MNTRTSESAAAAVWWFKLIMIILFRQRREYPELQKTAASHRKDNRGPEITDVALKKRTDSGREERPGIENVKAPASSHIRQADRNSRDNCISLKPRQNRKQRRKRFRQIFCHRIRI
jgi:hypothetical protein